MSYKRSDAIDTDIILRSVDGQEFPAHKFILSLASPVFRDMFTLSQPPQTQRIPLVDLSETARVLDLFLRCIYPISKLNIKDLELLEALVTTADKYDTEAILEVVEPWLMAPENLNEDPLRIYAIACASPALQRLAGAAVKCMTFNMVATADRITFSRLAGTKDDHGIITYLLRREDEARCIVDEPSWTVFYNPSCGCDVKARLQMREEIKRALTEAFVSNPSLSEEGAAVLACKQLSKVRACSSNQNCSLVVQGEVYAKELRGKLLKMSDKLWCPAR